MINNSGATAPINRLSGEILFSRTNLGLAKICGESDTKIYELYFYFHDKNMGRKML